MGFPIPGRIVEALRRSTVEVLSGSGHVRGSGSGVVLQDERVITNAHVIRAEPLHVDSWEGKRLTATLLKIDHRRDLALLKAPGLSEPAATFGDSDQLKPGTPVLAVGNPLGFSGAVSSGVVHHADAVGPLGGRRWIQADVRLAPGNSGGPLADYRGEIVGINTMIIAGGLAFAIPSRAVQRFILRAENERRLGVVLRPIQLTSGGLGMIILELEKGGAAEIASLLPGDILAGVDGVPLRDVDDLRAAIDSAARPALRLDFYRAGQKVLRHVTARLETERARNAA